jgi:anti-sigma B factor antagonist
MKYEFSIKGDVVIVKLSGGMLGGPESRKFHKKLIEHIEKGYRKFVLDLAKVTWMNSSGLGLLISVFTSIRRANGEVSMAAATERIKSLFTITLLDKIVKMSPSVDAALAELE